ncbi:monovalent cation/H(+) antiporter subunit G [Mycobacterium pseudokansasii]|uniref:Na(+)/H(+) antiporter subunit G n=1 Tax=Mycobacterium pseudokansasii TaxID=2341080 RepID=A0A498QNU2_9MYCO|nr:monovalent cation/H(+) antiporter subunit G [Mycobacterium pseudokansasii]VBA49388.1 hypothetical protein LAUMK142_01899 [Mycobacterium pseudokansasii]
MNAQSIGWAVVFVGVAAMSLSAVAATVRAQVFERLHLLAAATSVGVPLIGVGLVIVRGWTQASAMLVAISVVVLVTAPVVSAATGRLVAEHDGLIDETSPR